MPPQDYACTAEGERLPVGVTYVARRRASGQRAKVSEAAGCRVSEATKDRPTHQFNFPLSKVETQAFRRGFARQKVEPHLDFGNLDRQVDREYLCLAAIGARAPIAKIVWISARVN